MQLLIRLEESAFSQWLGLSMAGFPTLIALHSVGMAVVVGVSLMLTLRLYGYIDELAPARLPLLLNVGVAGFCLNLVTGAALFITRGSQYATSAIFLSKMALVLISAATLFVLRQRLSPLLRSPAAVLCDTVTRRMALTGTASWFAAVVTGRLIAYLSDIYG